MEKEKEKEKERERVVAATVLVSPRHLHTRDNYPEPSHGGSLSHSGAANDRPLNDRPLKNLSAQTIPIHSLKNTFVGGGTGTSSPRPWSSGTNSLSASGSKWKDSFQSRDTYGADGLCPPNTRIEEELFSEENSGINFEKYEDIPILIEDEEQHGQIENFSDIDLGPVITHNLGLAHFETPTPIQKASIPIVLKKRDLMACSNRKR